MHFSSLRIFLIAIALASLVVSNFGEVVVARQTESADNISLTCTAEDDRSALVWNDDLRQDSSDKNFTQPWPPHNPNCAIVAPSRCNVTWRDSDAWKIVNSSLYPIGPVFDARWEDFEQYSFPSSFWIDDFPSTYARTVVFSVRGKGNVSVKLCENNSVPLDLDSCFRITIPNDSLYDSGIFIDQVYLGKLQEEYGESTFAEHSEPLLDEFEWRTFSLEWTSNEVKISSNARIVANQSFELPIKAEYLFVESIAPGKIRFHNYDYYLVEQPNSTLSTSEFEHTEEIFCIELLVSLCSTCELNVQLVDRKNRTQRIGTIAGNQSADSSLPSWEFDKLNVTLLEDYKNPVRLEILSIMTQNSTKPRWAVDSFRKCQPAGAVRSISYRVEYVDSNITCQKLSYTGSFVVKYNATVTNHTTPQPPTSNGNSSLTVNSNSSGKSNLTDNNNSSGNRNLTDNVNSSSKSNSTDNNNSSSNRNLSDNSDSISNSILISKSDSSVDHDDPLKTGLIWLAVISALAICALLIFIGYQEYSSSPRSLELKKLLTRRQALRSFVRWTANRGFQEPPFLLPTINDAESLEDISKPEAESQLHSHCVIIKDFEDYVKNSITSGLLKSQFKMLPKGLVKPCKYGSLPENQPKNRYQNIIAYDDSRVMLEKVAGDPYSDYINANYVHGFKKQRSYIAAQGPVPETVADFWKMVWQTQSLVICMLANVVEGPKGIERAKCAQYWPNLEDSVKYGDIVIVNDDTRVFSDFTFRTFRVTCGQETRIIEHMHYTSWPDHGVPLYSYSVITYLKKIQTLPTGNGPIIAHCSAGIGRTGTIILCDICFHQANDEARVDVLAEFQKLRNCRSNMVDNELQYIFAHVVLVDWLVSLPTELPCNGTLPQMIEELKKNIPDHIERLDNTVWQEEALHALVSWSFFPPEPPMVGYPTRYSTAVIVDGVRMKNQYFASQLPQQSTLSNFWKFIAKQGIQLVIILQRPDADDPTYCSIIPGAELSDQVPLLNLELNESSEPDKFPTILTDKSETTFGARQVAVLTCLEWGPGKNGQAPSPDKLVEFWTESEKIRRGKRKTLVLCHDGITGCGLYLTLSFLLERMVVEKVCDVIFAVRATRRSRKEFVRSVEQFQYLYDAAAKYAESFETHMPTLHNC